MSQILKIVKLKKTKRILLVQSFILLFVVRLSLWLVPFRLTHKWLTFIVPSHICDTDVDWRMVKRIVRSVETSSRFVPFATCLTKALATLVLLRLHKQDSNLKFGVAKNDQNHFEAHAWVVTKDKIVIGRLPDQHRFKTLYSTAGKVL